MNLEIVFVAESFMGTTNLVIKTRDISRHIEQRRIFRNFLNNCFFSGNCIYGKAF